MDSAGERRDTRLVVNGESFDLVRRAYDVFDTDLDALVQMLDPNVEWVSPSDSIEPGTRRGHEGVRSAYAATAAAWDRPSHTPEEFLDGGEKVLVAVTFRGHGRGSGMEAERPEFHVWTIQDGRVMRFEWFYQREQGLQAAGLLE
jgi:ketosteroid isomerase-like protein